MYTLAIDVGGSAVKYGFYRNDSLLDTKTFEHQYLDLEREKRGFLDEISLISRGKKISSIGMGIAGLVGTDDSIYRSTVLGSLVGFHFPSFLSDEFDIDSITVDNDADCGGIGEFFYHKRPLLYLVMGSGLGSAYVDKEGHLSYRVRLDPNHKYQCGDNPLLNDLGLGLYLNTGFVRHKLLVRGASSTSFDDLLEKCDHSESGSKVRLGNLASATGLVSICRALGHPEVSNGYEVSVLASNKDIRALSSFSLVQSFLLYGILHAEYLLHNETGSYADIVLGGGIVSSPHIMCGPMNALLKTLNIPARIKKSDMLIRGENPNLRGAWVQASRSHAGVC